MAVEYKILSISQPKIALETLDKAHLEKADRNNYKMQPAPTEATGAVAPFVKINDHYINGGDIMSFQVTQNSFLPEISISFIDRDKVFTGVRSPKYKPIMSVYVKSTHTQLKPFRADFLITSIKPAYGPTPIYDVRGELYVPNLYNNVSKAYPDMTSFDALRKIAEELGLGFASNEEKPNDKMTWLSPNINYKGLIKRIVDFAYKDDSSFFTCFIDRYYMLNYVNVEKIMQATDLDETLIGLNQAMLGQTRLNYSNEKEVDYSTPAIVTNHPNAKQSDGFIISYGFMSEHGQVLKEEFIRKRAIWYDHNKEQDILSFFQEPITRQTPVQGQEYQLTQLDDFKKGEIVKWLGIDYHNAHKNYKFARLINDHNNRELDKNLLKVTLRGFNGSLMRGQKVLTAIFVDRTEQLSIETNSQDIPSGSLDRSTYVDEYTTGQYYIKEIVYKYRPVGPENKNRFVTELWLARKEWKPSKTFGL